MKFKFLIPCALLILITTQLPAQPISNARSRTMASNWMTLYLTKHGDWGGNQNPSLVSVEEYKRGDRTLGYYCKVEPSGFIIVPLLEGLAPIACFSTDSDLDPLLDEGPGDLTKYLLERNLNGIEKYIGPLSTITPDKLRPYLQRDYSGLWTTLSQDPAVFKEDLNNGLIADGYIEHTELLSSSWDQSSPYYNECPSDGDVCDHPHCAVGCVATAGAQIARYWSWPPGRDWFSMKDEVQDTSPQNEIDAVAELSHYIGVAADMSYCDGDCGSATATSDMEEVFEGMLYDIDCAVALYSDHNADEWWDLILTEINSNRPIEYRILGHAIVCDGYLDEGLSRMYHMNYGWDNSFTDWYSLDQLHYPDPDGELNDEYMVLRIKPGVSLGAIANGTFVGYNYINRDCAGNSVEFLAPSQIQFLSSPRVVLTCSSGFVKITGTPTQQSSIFTIDQTFGVKVTNSSFVMYPGGSIKMHRDRPDIY
jgi:hypothetical protein